MTERDNDPKGGEVSKIIKDFVESSYPEGKKPSAAERLLDRLGNNFRRIGEALGLNLDRNSHEKWSEPSLSLYEDYKSGTRLPEESADSAVKEIGLTSLNGVKYEPQGVDGSNSTISKSPVMGPPR